MGTLHQKRAVRSIDPAARRGKRAFNTLAASSVGLELGVAVILSLLFGMWLDDRFGTTPWLTLVFVGLGIAAGFRNVLRAVKRVERAAAEEEREERGDPHG